MHSASGLSVCRMFVTIPCGSWMDHCFFQYYAHGDAWRLPTGADAALRELKDAGGQLLLPLFSPSRFLNLDFQFSVVYCN